jgi:hypothetical protein
MLNSGYQMRANLFVCTVKSPGGSGTDLPEKVSRHRSEFEATIRMSPAPQCCIRMILYRMYNLPCCPLLWSLFGGIMTSIQSRIGSGTRVQALLVRGRRCV